ncbi:hypothetical protein H70357_04335 [Paenibacillus sp. FSL H7-0357]|uniref:DUF2569 family protein n=1 Tax=unclassified Paenibacillus TaxID=185978 RepID=UPI0004F7B1C1|nr:DUF2569 family protein [Paenibacillus sp. FSL H7-0357]AIQ15992.1 hypothetical protein H70357_04335 [Paenibacillus sp. FSL H7-0357]
MVDSKFNLDALSGSSISNDTEIHKAYGHQGFGGWLIFFQISIWLGFILVIFKFSKDLVLDEFSSIMKVTEKSWELSPEYVFSHWLAYLQNPFFIVLLLVIIFLFYFKKKQTIHWVRGYLIVISLISIANCWLSYYSGNYYIGEPLIMVTIVSVIKNLIWTAYFTLSERVENTFDQ